MLNRSNPYFRQVELLLALMPLVGRESCFALKGGSAINLFMRDLPRLSVDLDLTFLPVKERNASLLEIDLALDRIAKSVRQSLPDVAVRQAGGMGNARTKLFFSRGGERVKVETSPVLRGTVGKPEVRGVCPEIEKQFGYSEMNIVHPHDLFAGKLCAALDRQHPRDLFDVKLLMENEGIGDELMQVFMVSLWQFGIVRFLEQENPTSYLTACIAAGEDVSDELCLETLRSVDKLDTLDYAIWCMGMLEKREFLLGIPNYLNQILDELLISKA